MLVEEEKKKVNRNIGIEKGEEWKSRINELAKLSIKKIENKIKSLEGLEKKGKEIFRESEKVMI